MRLNKKGIEIIFDCMKTHKITILSLSWRDICSKKAGGAEVHTHEMLKRLDKNKYRVIHLSMKEKDTPSYEKIDGVNYIRKGNVFTVIFDAFLFYRKNKNSIDFVIDQCNTHRFFTSFWVPAKKRIFYIHQLTREIWDINFGFPFNVIGRLSEDLMLKLNRHDPVITVSKETASELREVGFDNKIKIIHNGVSFKPWGKGKWCDKEGNPTFIYAGRYAAYKGIDVAIKALAKVKRENTYAKLWLIGKKDKEYVEKKLLPICKKHGLTWEDLTYCEIGTERYMNADIVCFGYVSEEEKLQLISRADALLFPSIREGWGIPITEAGCVGTPSIVYNSPGISEAVDYGRAGYLCDTNSYVGLYKQMKRVIEDKAGYSKMQSEAYSFSSNFQWDSVGNELDDFLENMIDRRECFDLSIYVLSKK